jgi:hypothetical protein
MQANRRHRCLLNTLTLVIVFFVFHATARPETPPTQSRINLPIEAIAGWKEMEEAVRVAQLEFQFDLDGMQFHVLMAIQDDLVKTEESQRKKNGELKKTANIFNRGGYKLTQKGKAWELARVFHVDEFFPQIANARACAADGFSLCSFCKLRSIQDSKDYTVALWEESVSKPDQIDFWVDYTKASSGKIFDRAKIAIDPKKRFRVKEVFFERDGTDDGRFEFEYKDDSKINEIVPSLVRQTYGTQFEIHTLSTSTERLPVSAFTLGHYGLPEHRVPMNISDYLFVSGIGLIAIIGLLWFRSKRRPG